MRLNHAVRVAATAAVSAAAVIGLNPAAASAGPATNLVLWTDTGRGQHVIVPAVGTCYNVSPAGIELYNQTASFTVALYNSGNCTNPKGPIAVVGPGSHITNVYFVSLWVTQL